MIRSLVAAAALACGLAGCSPTLQPCYADDLIFGEDADDESVAELAIVGCVTGDILVENTLIETLALPLLDDVGGALIVSQNLLLGRVDLPALANVGGLFEVSLNATLAELSLPALMTVGDDLIVSGNPELPADESGDAFADVEVGGETRIE